MRTILLKSYFLALAPFMMHGMDIPLTPSSKPKRTPRVIPLPEKPIIMAYSDSITPTRSLAPQSRQQRSKTNPDESSPFIQSKTNSDVSPHFTQSDSSSSTEKSQTRPNSSAEKFQTPRSRSTESAVRGRSKQNPKDKPRKLFSASPSKKYGQFSFDNLRTVIEKNDIESLRVLLSNCANNPNIQNIYGITPLHIAVMSQKEGAIQIDAIQILVQNPRVNSLIRNADNKPAYAYAKEAFPAMYNLLSQRATLDHIVYAFLVTNKMFFKTPLNNTKIAEKIENLLKRLPAQIIPSSYADNKFINSMVHSCLDYDRKRLKKDFLNFSKNPNYQGIYGDTLVHLFIYLHNEEKVDELIKNPLISFILTNNDGYFPHALLSSEKNNISDMSLKLFIRDSLERWIRTAVDNVPMDYPTEDISNPSALTVQSPLIQKIIAQVKLRSVEIKELQPTPDGKLPSTASNIPGYATDKFFLGLTQDQFRKITLPSNQKMPFMITETAASKALDEKMALQAIKLTVIKDMTKTDLEEVAAQYYLKLYQAFRENMLSQVATQIDMHAKDTKINLEEDDRKKLIDKTTEELAMKAAQEFFQKAPKPFEFPQ